MLSNMSFIDTQVLAAHKPGSFQTETKDIFISEN